MKDDYKILYILGPGHSGSTLIEMLVGTSKTAFSAGELAFYSHYTERIPHKKIDKKKGYICTCGKKVIDCAFWKVVKKRVTTKGPIIKNRGHIDTYKIFFNILNPFDETLSFSTKISDNKGVYDALFREAKKMKPKLKIIIDSSKDPRRLYELIKDKRIKKTNIKVLYLVRDGRAYLNSYKKDVKTISGVDDRNMFVTLFEWIGVHIASRALIKKYDLEHLNIKYHKFANSPEKHVDLIFDFLGLGEEKQLNKIIKKINKQSYHNLHGNHMKFNKINKIFYDESWKSGLDSVEKLVSTLVLFPFNTFWVFN